MFLPFILLCLVYFHNSESRLWPKGVVHYAINPKDYDIHSQDEIESAFSDMQKEICVKFFRTPLNFNASVEQKVLYINNPDKQKNCIPHRYNYSGSVVDMIIGYKCINKQDVARQTVEMLKASILQTSHLMRHDAFFVNILEGKVNGRGGRGRPRLTYSNQVKEKAGNVLYQETKRFLNYDDEYTPINSFDLVKRFEERDQVKPRPTFLTTQDRDYINAHYHRECSALSSRATEFAARRSGDQELGRLAAVMSPENEAYYKKLVWPYGLVVYSVNDSLLNTESYRTLIRAMNLIELSSCIIFHKDPKGNPGVIRFEEDGEDEPQLGVTQEDQRINIHKMTHGAPGHTSHAVNNLFRTLGLPMMSNRYDRDNFITVLWAHVQRGKERLLEKQPKDSWVMGIPYDFTSVTHAPTNYICGDCQPGDNTVQPLQDYMWKNSLAMGHQQSLSEADKTLLQLTYAAECKTRYVMSRE